MLIYILKSFACMAIFWVFYKLLLERESMHVFKRFFLLFALIVSLIIPMLVFTEYVISTPAAYEETAQLVGDTYYSIPPEPDHNILNIELILLTLYVIGFIFFGFKFIKNLSQIIWRIRKNPTQKLPRFVHVLLDENMPPHTFFKYIFLNKKKLEANEIPKEVLLHEETHARQKHSWDVIFIELIQLLFWFNPMVYFFKHSIKLNHEFLADRAVLKKDFNKTTYQNTLLSYLSHRSEQEYQSYLANAINYSSYSSIKKRFTVMKKRSSKISILVRTLLLLPLLALLIYGFSTTEIVYEQSNNAQFEQAQYNTLDVQPLHFNQEEEVANLIIHVSKEGYLLIERKVVSMAEAELVVKELVQQNEMVRALILPDAEAPEQLIDSLNSMLEKHQLVHIQIVGHDDADIDTLLQSGATKTELNTFHRLVKKYNNQKIGKRSIRFDEVEKIAAIYQKMTAAPSASTNGK